MLTPDQIIAEHKKNETEKKDVLFRMFCKANDFTPSGVTYVPNTISEQIVSILKLNHCAYAKHLGYHASSPVEGVPMSPVFAKDIVRYDPAWECYVIDEGKAKDTLTSIFRSTMTKEEIGFGYSGEIGDRVFTPMKFNGGSRVKSKSDFGDFYALEFTDKDNRHYSWLQRNFSIETVNAFVKKYSKDGYILVCGTVKRHDVIRGRKCTLLSRCEVSCRKAFLHKFAEALRERSQKRKLRKLKSQPKKSPEE